MTIEKIEVALAIIGVIWVIALYLFTRYGKEPDQDEHEEHFI